MFQWEEQTGYRQNNYHNVARVFLRDYNLFSFTLHFIQYVGILFVTESWTKGVSQVCMFV